MFGIISRIGILWGFSLFLVLGKIIIMIFFKVRGKGLFVKFLFILVIFRVY